MTTDVKTNGKAKVNRIGLTQQDYHGGATTLCPGCGHNSITSQIIAAAYDLSLPPHRVIKFSGIGCSSKTPAYFFNRSHGFNTLHGRMPSVATGATLANRTMLAIGVSGDGDTGSIGLGQFKHMVRRNVPMVYIIENNGVYGLTKGQFSATADMGQNLKYAGTQRAAADRRVYRGADRRLRLRGALVRRRCQAGARAAQGGDELQRHGGARHHQPVRDLQQQRGLDQELPYGKEHEEPIQDIQFIPAFEEVKVEL